MFSNWVASIFSLWDTTSDGGDQRPEENVKVTEGSAEASEMEIADPIQIPPFQRSNPSAQVPPFPMLIGEHPLLISKTIEGNAMVSNFRFCVVERRSLINIPLTMVGELLVIEGAKRLRIGCKDGSTYSCTFATVDDSNMCTAVLREKSGQPLNLKGLFAFRFYALALYKESLAIHLTPSELEQISMCKPVSADFAYSFGKEVERLGFDTSNRRIWRMSHANENFEFCATYPKFHILPAAVDDEKLKFSLDFRAMKRFPSVVWRDKTSGMVLIRSSQPLTSFFGLSYFYNHADVFLIEEIVNACNKDREMLCSEEQSKAGPAISGSEVTDIVSGQENGPTEKSSPTLCNQDGAQGPVVSDDLVAHGASNGTYAYNDNDTPRKLAIVDCRSLAGVWGNSFKGGGTEDEVVYKCNTIHLDLANIHTVRDSFNRLRTLCHSYVEGTFYKNLTGCMWLAYISALLRGANIVVELMHVKKRPVLVHCSDGWDRTSQIVSLSELMMDPHYRTLQGFQVLIEREWLHFGHKFGERGGHDPNCSDTNQISPIFLQFLDCVYQLTLQYPAEFQFNEAYLVKLLKHSQACLFGNFLHNCPKEREHCTQKTASVWALLRPENLQFVNLLYKPTCQVLTARYSEHDMVLWKSVYMAGLSPYPHGSQTDFFLDSTLVGNGEEMGNPAVEGMPRSRSMDDLSRINADNGRRNSDPSAIQSQEVAAATPVTGGIHDTSSSSAEILHYPEDSPPSGKRPSPSLKVEENSSPRRLSPNTSNSIRTSPALMGCSSSQIGAMNEEVGTHADLNPSGSDAQDTPGDVNAEVPLQVLLKHPLVSGAKLEESESEGGSISELDHVLIIPEDSKTQNLVPSSSAVFCQENEAVTSSTSEQTSCCDNAVEVVMAARTDSQVLSSDNNLSNLLDNVSDSDARTRSCCSHQLVDNGAAATHSPQKETSRHADITSNHHARQTSLLAERLASSGDLTINGCIKHASEKVNQPSISEDNQHSMKFDINDHHPVPKVQTAWGEASKKLLLDSSHCTITSNGKSGAPANILDSSHYSSCTSPSKSVVLGARTNVNSVSTDTLTDEVEVMGRESPSTVLTTKSLEVNARQDKHVATAPLTLSASASVPSTLKRDSHSSESNEAVNGTHLISRRARAASGASRDLSVSPSMSQCVCRGNWSDTGRLRHPSGGEMVARRWLGATVATSTTDISDSFVGQQQTLPSVDRQQSLKQHIDVDGLTLFSDERQDLLTELVSEKDRKIFELENRLQFALELLKSSRVRHQSQQHAHNAILDEFLTNDTEGGELISLGTMSNPASDASWETIDESEAKIVLWVPDSAVTHCAGCDGAFWLGKRKHHCRNCGKVFCSECSNYMAPVPHQHLNKPERVCRRCHSDLLQLSPGASSDRRIPTLVADG